MNRIFGTGSALIESMSAVRETTNKWVMAALCVVAIGAGLTTSPAYATVILNISNNELVGAQNVSVNSTLYDVMFVDGSCFSIFDECNDVEADFNFFTEATALAAGQALLDQVFVNIGSGDFDDSPELTFGCSDNEECITIIPFILGPAGELFGASVTNNRGGALIDLIALTPGPIDADSGLFKNLNWAVFTPSVTIPEPSALLLFGVGLVFLGALRRRRRQT